MRKSVTFRLDTTLLERARQHATADHRSLTNFVEIAVLRVLESDQPEPERLNTARGVSGEGAESIAIEPARSCPVATNEAKHCVQEDDDERG